MDHIAKSDFPSFFSKPSRPLHARVSGHLLDGCTSCLEMAKQALWERKVARPLAATSRALAAVLEEAALLKEERARAVARWARLAALEKKQRLEAVRTRRGREKLWPRGLCLG